MSMTNSQEKDCRILDADKLMDFFFKYKIFINYLLKLFSPFDIKKGGGRLIMDYWVKTQLDRKNMFILSVRQTAQKVHFVC